MIGHAIAAFVFIPALDLVNPTGGVAGIFLFGGIVLVMVGCGEIGPINKPPYSPPLLAQ